MGTRMICGLLGVFVGGLMIGFSAGYKACERELSHGVREIEYEVRKLKARLAEYEKMPYAGP